VSGKRGGKYGALYLTFKCEVYVMPSRRRINDPHIYHHKWSRGNVEGSGDGLKEVFFLQRKATPIGAIAFFGGERRLDSLPERTRTDQYGNLGGKEENNELEKGLKWKKTYSLKSSIGKKNNAVR